MKFKCVRIEPDGDNWKVRVEADAQDRENVETQPNPLGFFWFNERTTESEAIQLLLAVMIKYHEESITKTTASRDKLNFLSQRYKT